MYASVVFTLTCINYFNKTCLLMCAENALMFCELQITELYTLFCAEVGKLFEQNITKKLAKKWLVTTDIYQLLVISRN